MTPRTTQTDRSEPDSIIERSASRDYSIPISVMGIAVSVAIAVSGWALLKINANSEKIASIAESIYTIREASRDKEQLGEQISNLASAIYEFKLEVAKQSSFKLELIGRARDAAEQSLEMSRQNQISFKEGIELLRKDLMKNDAPIGEVKP